MIVLFTTVRRQRPVREGGEFVALDWGTKRALYSQVLFPSSPDIIHDPNPRGNSRGGKGIVATREKLMVATYHTILVFDRDFHLKSSISNNLFVNIHEMCLSGSDNPHIWVSSTAIDAAVQVDTTGRTVRTWWPREDPELQARFGFLPMAIDKAADNRLVHVVCENEKKPEHTHLNSIFHYAGRTYAYLNRFGAIVQIEPDTRVVIQHQLLQGGHSPLVAPEGNEIWACSSQRRLFVSFALADGKKLFEIDLMSFPAVEELCRKYPDQPFNKSIFARGLARLDADHVLIGISPAAILEVNIRRRKLTDCYIHSQNVADSVHGLAIIPGS